MPVGRELISYIATASTRFVLGSSTGGIPLTMNRFPPDAANTAVALYESGGTVPLYTQGGGITIERPTVQVLSRSTSYATARDNAEHIFSILGSVTNASVSKTTSTGVTSYISVTPIQSPTDIGQDAEERSLVTCNYSIEKGLS